MIRGVTGERMRRGEPGKERIEDAICIFSWYERYLVSFVIFRHLLNIHAYGVSLVNPSLCLYAIYCTERSFSLSQVIRVAFTV